MVALEESHELITAGMAVQELKLLHGLFLLRKVDVQFSVLLCCGWAFHALCI